MSYELLSEPIRKYIRDKRWESLRPIQAAAIQRIISTNENYILASRTASGKTEAAFLPILSKVDFSENGVQVLYISPLIALINDQFFRIEQLCQYLDVNVTKWHGEANISQKNKLLADPKGVVLITPESLEAMFANSPYRINKLFSNLKFLVIDEIHSFIGTDRGTQLKSILSRLQQICQNKFNIIGLSATIGDYNEAKELTGDENNTKVLLDKTTKEIETYFKYFKENNSTELPNELVTHLYAETKDDKVLIFPNSRGRAEEVAVRLKRISEKSQGHQYYFSHHSSVDKELREYIEHFAKNNQRNNFCISCTSTLELGIDIGTVDEVVQIDATNSVSSLIQRVGRSGRRDGQKSVLFLYATNKWSLLQSLACWCLYGEGFIEPAMMSKKPYDILLHQMLSIVKQKSGCGRIDLVQRAGINFAFKTIPVEAVQEIIDELIKDDMLEVVERELIIGLTGERIVNSKDFYSVFKTEPNFKVTNSGRTIGEIPISPQIIVDENILLAAKIWKIIDIDYTSKKIIVIPAKDGKKPKFFGSGVVVHPKIRTKMLEILTTTDQYTELDQAASEALRELRKEFKDFSIHNIEFDRPLIYKDTETVMYSFQGTKVNRSLDFLLGRLGVSCHYNDQSTAFEIPVLREDFGTLIDRLLSTLNELDSHLHSTVKTNSALLEFSKWGGYLPVKFQVEVLKDKYFDFDATKVFLQHINLLEMATR